MTGVHNEGRNYLQFRRPLTPPCVLLFIYPSEKVAKLPTLSCFHGQPSGKLKTLGIHLIDPRNSSLSQANFGET